MSAPSKFVAVFILVVRVTFKFAFNFHEIITVGPFFKQKEVERKVSVLPTPTTRETSSTGQTGLMRRKRRQRRKGAGRQTEEQLSERLI